MGLYLDRMYFNLTHFFSRSLRKENGELFYVPYEDSLAGFPTTLEKLEALHSSSGRFPTLQGDLRKIGHMIQLLQSLPLHPYILFTHYSFKSISSFNFCNRTGEATTAD